jgi:hypothetical protein
MGSSEPGAETPRALRRRDFLAGTLAAAGAIAVGAPAAPAAPAAAAARGATTLSAPRAQTYRALVTALRHAPDGRFRHARPGPAAATFARWYGGQAAGVRHHVDTVLDLLRAAGPVRYDRLARPVAGCSDAARARHQAAIAAGVALAAVAIAPPPPPGERPFIAPLASRGPR